MIYKEAKDIAEAWEHPIPYYPEEDGNVEISQRAKDTYKMVDYYSMSKYLTGQEDEYGRRIPFFNIGNFRVTIAKVATDYDTKDFPLKTDNPNHEVHAFLLTKEARKWMDKSHFNRFLNEFTYTRPKHGGVFVKKREDEGELYLDVIKQRNLIHDQVNPTARVIEKHWLSPVQLSEKKAIWKNIDDDVMKLFDNEDNIEVWEVHGLFQEKVYRQAWTRGKKGEKYKQYRFFILAPRYGKERVFYANEENETPYRYLAWEDVGRGWGRGVWEEVEEAQFFTNEAKRNENDAMELAGKVNVAITHNQEGSSPVRSALQMENGLIWNLSQGEAIQGVSLAPNTLPLFSQQVQEWMQQADKAVNTYDANTGETPPSGTPYSQTALLSRVASRPFDFRKEEAGIFLSEIFSDWVIPHLKKKLRKEHILVSEYTNEELEMIDESFGNKEAKEYAKKMLLNAVQNLDEAELPTQETMEQVKKQAIDAIRQSKRRYIKIPEKYFDGVNVYVDPSGEKEDKQVVLQSLSQILRDVMGSYNQETGTFAILEDPKLSRIFNKILETADSGISPVSLGSRAVYV
jgi:hypothetical protein